MALFKNFSVRVKKVYPQALAAFAVWIVTLQIGLMCAWSSPYLAQLTAPDSPLPLTLTEASWAASLLFLGRLIGSLLGAVSVSWFGTKKTTLVTAIPIALGWVLMIPANSPIWLYAARTCLGMGYGFAYSCFTLYLGEVAEPEIRGSLVVFSMMGAPVGNFLGCIMGSMMSLRTSSITYFSPCVLLVILLCLLPDSPHHLVKIEDIKAARKSIAWYWGSDKVEDKLEEVTRFVKATSAASFTEKMAEFKHPHVRKATVLVILLFAFMQLCGLNNLLLYMELILIRSKTTVIQPSNVVSYVFVCSIVVSMTLIGLYDKCGRRVFLIISASGVTASLTAIATHFLLQEQGVVWVGSQWLPIAAVFTFIIFFPCGLSPLPSVISSEVYSANIKSIACCIANITAAGVAFFSSKSYQPMVDLFGEAYVFYGHAIVTFLAVPYAIFYLPETRGKTLQQIQDLLKK